jgi:hypothetical protein
LLLVCLLVYIFILVGLGFELRALYLQSLLSTTWGTRPVHIALVILELVSLKLFAWASFEPRSFQS